MKSVWRLTCICVLATSRTSTLFRPPVSLACSELPCTVCNLTNTEAFALLSNTTLIQLPFTRPSYSNAGFDVLGHVLAAVVGQRYEDWVVENILGPLGMSSSGFNLTTSVLKRLATGTQTGAPPSLHWGNPDGGLYSTAEDMAKFLAFLANPSATGLLRDQTVAQWVAPMFLLPDGVSGYGMPWELQLDQTGNGTGWWFGKCVSPRACACDV